MNYAFSSALKVLYTNLMCFICFTFGYPFAKKLDAYIRFKRRLNLNHPESLADKVSYLELFEVQGLKITCTDKYACREYVKQKGFTDILIPVYTKALTSFEQLNFNKLPQTFVIKATHGCRMNLVVHDKNSLDLETTQKEIQTWLSTTYGLASIEPHYRCLEHRFYVEKYMGSNLFDYKIHCLNGEPEFILVCSNRESKKGAPTKVDLDVFDIKWNKIDCLVPFGNECPGKGEIEKPKHLDMMLSIARKLAEEFKFVRVDLYEIEDKVYFGELTFSPATCVFPYLSERFLKQMGKKLDIT
jgi:hypothetical protein